MADLDAKKYLDLAGLQRYDEKIKKYSDDGDAATLQSAKDYTDGKIGNLDAAYTTVAAAITGEYNRATGVEGALADLTTDAKTSLVAAINEVDAHADAAQADVDALELVVGAASNADEGLAATGLVARIESLESKSGTDSVADQIKTAIEALDAEKSQTAGADGLALSITEVDGKITAISGSIAAETYDAYGAASAVQGDTTSTVKGLEDKIGTVPAKVGETDTTTVVSYVDAKVAEAVDGLDDELAAVAKSGAAADVSIADAGDKITATTVEGALQELAGKIDTLNGAETAEGSVKKIAKDAAETAVTNLVDGAPEALDTLKEIADWIANQDQDGVTDAASLVARVDENTTAIGTASKTEGETVTPGTGLTGRIETLEASVGTGGSVDTKIKTAIEALDATVEQAAGTDGLALTVVETDGKLTSVSGSIAANTYDAYGAASAVQGETTETVASVNAKIGAFTPITDDEIDALFTTPADEPQA